MPQAEWGEKPRESVTVMPFGDKSDTLSAVLCLRRHRGRRRSQSDMDMGALSVQL
mgnify:FL=1